MARASCHNLQVSLGHGLDMRNIAVGNYSPMFVEGDFCYCLPWDLSPAEKGDGWKYILQVVLSFFQLLFMSNAYPSNLVVFSHISLHKT